MEEAGHSASLRAMNAMQGVVPENFHTPPPPPQGRSLKIPRRRGGSKTVISERWGGSCESIFQRVTDRVQNIESNV